MRFDSSCNCLDILVDPATLRTKKCCLMRLVCLTVDVVVLAVRPSELRILGGSVDTRPLKAPQFSDGASLDPHGPNQVEGAHAKNAKTLR